MNAPQPTLHVDKRPQPVGAASPRLTVPAIFQMMQAYKITALLATGIELGVFDCMAAGATDALTVATRLHLDPRATKLLMNALAAIGLLEPSGGGHRLSPETDSYLVRKRPGYVGDMTRVMASRWEWSAIQQLPEAVRKGGTVMPEHAETPGYEYWEDFAAHATAVAKPTAELTAEVIAHWASGRRRLDILDVACGHGMYGFTLARQHPQAHVWSLDWPNVLPIAHGHAVQMGVADRVSMIAGDMFTIPLGGPYDVVMVTNVLHHFSEQRATELLRRLCAVLCSGGRLIVVGFAVGEGPAAMDPAPHLFSILMLVWTTQGEVHSMAAYERMMAGAGLLSSNMYNVPGLPLHVMIADKP